MITDYNIFCKDLELDKIYRITKDNSGNKWFSGLKNGKNTLAKIDLDGNRKLFSLNSTNRSFRIKGNYIKTSVHAEIYSNDYIEMFEKVHIIKDEKFIPKIDSNAEFLSFFGTSTENIYITLNKTGDIQVHINSNGEETSYPFPYNDIIEECFILNNGCYIIFSKEVFYLLTPNKHRTYLVNRKLGNIWKKKNGMVLSDIEFDNKFFHIDSSNQFTTTKVNLKKPFFLWEDNVNNFWYRAGKIGSANTFHIQDAKQIKNVEKYFGIDPIIDIKKDAKGSIWILNGNSLNQIISGKIASTVPLPDSIKYSELKILSTTHSIINGPDNIVLLVNMLTAESGLLLITD